MGMRMKKPSLVVGDKIKILSLGYGEKHSIGQETSVIGFDKKGNPFFEGDSMTGRGWDIGDEKYAIQKLAKTKA